MKVMLTKDVENVGTAGDIKEVADGYGRNFLIPRKLRLNRGCPHHEEANRIRAAAARREAKERDTAQELADSIGDKTVVCRLRVGDEDRVFGAVTSEDIARALQAQHNVEVDRRRIELREPIKQLGEHQVSLRLHRDVQATIHLIVTQDR